MLGDDDGSTLRRSYHRILIAFLALLSTPIVLMYLWLLLASVNRESPGEFPANGVDATALALSVGSHRIRLPFGVDTP